ncbi:MAG: hypothetical protein KIH69_017165 [Anaerolineae bacterium]|nr:hypothetical protein [Anaerolineae bacterium]
MTREELLATIAQAKRENWTNRNWTTRQLVEIVKAVRLNVDID